MNIRNTLRTRSIAFILIGALVLPIVALVPFAVHATKLNPVLAFSSVAGERLGCIASDSVVQQNQCATWVAPNLWPWAIAGLVAIGAISLALAYTARHLDHAQAKQFASVRFYTAILVGVVTFIAYVIMRSYSQNNGDYDLGFVSATQISTGAFVPTHTAALGYGIRPAELASLLALYLLCAAFDWYKFFLSGRHIKGQKKQLLFQ